MPRYSVVLEVKNTIRVEVEAANKKEAIRLAEDGEGDADPDTEEFVEMGGATGEVDKVE